MWSTITEDCVVRGEIVEDNNRAQEMSGGRNAPRAKSDFQPGGACFGPKRIRVLGLLHHFKVAKVGESGSEPKCEAQKSS